MQELVDLNFSQVRGIKIYLLNIYILFFEVYFLLNKVLGVIYFIGR